MISRELETILSEMHHQLVTLCRYKIKIEKAMNDLDYHEDFVTKNRECADFYFNNKADANMRIVNKLSSLCNKYFIDDTFFYYDIKRLGIYLDLFGSNITKDDGKIVRQRYDDLLKLHKTINDVYFDTIRLVNQVKNNRVEGPVVLPGAFDTLLPELSDIYEELGMLRNDGVMDEDEKLKKSIYNYRRLEALLSIFDLVNSSGAYIFPEEYETLIKENAEISAEQKEFLETHASNRSRRKVGLFLVEQKGSDPVLRYKRGIKLNVSFKEALRKVENLNRGFAVIIASAAIILVVSLWSYGWNMDSLRSALTFRIEKEDLYSGTTIHPVEKKPKKSVSDKTGNNNTQSDKAGKSSEDTSKNKVQNASGTVVGESAETADAGEWDVMASETQQDTGISGEPGALSVPTQENPPEASQGLENMPSEATADLMGETKYNDVNYLIYKKGNVVYLAMDNESIHDMSYGWVGASEVTLKTTAGEYISNLNSFMSVKLYPGEEYYDSFDFSEAEGDFLSLTINTVYILGDSGLPANFEPDSVVIDFLI